ncbi:MAG: PEP-CTERM sorting domain-containing protein, partial [Pseudomonadales bacterium]|nr:PEP-CTERM sorting domain-containing protein [Pseudomonadales bacterium]
MKKFVLGFLVFAFNAMSGVAFAGIIDIQQYSGFLYSESLGGSSLEYTDYGYFQDDFSGLGLTTSFENNLDTENLGSVSWSFTNDTGGVLDDAWFFVFIDAEIDQALNTFFNEFGSLVSVTGLGAGDNLADSWEIDEPGYVFGDIYDNLLDGFLDNSNEVYEGFEDDVSLALGFNLGSLGLGDEVLVTSTCGRDIVSGLSHSDSDSADTIYCDGTADVFPSAPVVDVPEPSSFAIFLAGLSIAYFGRRKSILKRN